MYCAFRTQGAWRQRKHTDGAGLSSPVHRSASTNSAKLSDTNTPSISFPSLPPPHSQHSSYSKVPSTPSTSKIINSNLPNKSMINNMNYNTNNKESNNNNNIHITMNRHGLDSRGGIVTMNAAGNDTKQTAAAETLQAVTRGMLARKSFRR